MGEEEGEGEVEVAQWVEGETESASLKSGEFWWGGGVLAGLA